MSTRWVLTARPAAACSKQLKKWSSCSGQAFRQAEGKLDLPTFPPAGTCDWAAPPPSPERTSGSEILTESSLRAYLRPMVAMGLRIVVVLTPKTGQYLALSFSNAHCATLTFRELAMQPRIAHGWRRKGAYHRVSAKWSSPRIAPRVFSYIHTTHERRADQTVGS